MDSYALDTSEAVLRAIARAPIAPWTEEEEQLVAEAQAEEEPSAGSDEVVARLQDHFHVTAADWAAADLTEE